MRRAAFALALLASPVAHADMDIKGVAIGMARADVMAKYGDLFCSHVAPGVEVCGDIRSDRSSSAPLRHAELDTYGGEKVKGFYVHLRHGIVSSVSVRMDSTHYFPVTMALAGKYGAANAKETSVVQNRMGASFDQEEQTWKRGDLSIVAKKRSSRLTEMEVKLVSEAQRLQQIEEMKAKAKGSAKDL